MKGDWDRSNRLLLRLNSILSGVRGNCTYNFLAAQSLSPSNDPSLPIKKPLHYVFDLVIHTAGN